MLKKMRCVIKMLLLSVLTAEKNLSLKVIRYAIEYAQINLTQDIFVQELVLENMVQIYKMDE